MELEVVQWHGLKKELKNLFLVVLLNVATMFGLAIIVGIVTVIKIGKMVSGA